MEERTYQVMPAGRYWSMTSEEHGIPCPYTKDKGMTNRFDNNGSGKQNVAQSDGAIGKSAASPPFGIGCTGNIGGSGRQGVTLLTPPV